MKYGIQRNTKTKAFLNEIRTYTDTKEEYTKVYEVSKIKKKGFGDALEIKFVDSDAPTFSLKTLLELSEFFGTKDIDFNNSIHNDGCPTCGAGSEYGYELEVYRITKNYPF